MGETSESDDIIQQQTSLYLSEGSALLSKVALFLPKLKQANETLDSHEENIDFDLEQHNDDESESVDSIDSTESDEKDADKESNGQVIEMNIALGDVSQDPVFHMLGANDSNESDSEDSQQSTGETENAIHNLLHRKRTSSPVDCCKSKQPKKSGSPLIQVIHEASNPNE